MITIGFTWTNKTERNCGKREKLTTNIAYEMVLSLHTATALSFTHERQINIEKWITQFPQRVQWSAQDSAFRIGKKRPSRNSLSLHRHARFPKQIPSKNFSFDIFKWFDFAVFPFGTWRVATVAFFPINFGGARSQFKLTEYCNNCTPLVFPH